MNAPTFTTFQRETIFRRIVALQDAGTPVDECREIVARKYRCSPELVRLIEEEGIREDWPIPDPAKGALN